jgi:simple sugar transport system permease protein
VALIVAMIASGLLALLLAVLSIKYKVDQIISGTVINIFAAGLTGFVTVKYLNQYQNLNSPSIFSPIRLPLLSKIPILGPIFFEVNIIVYIAFILIIAIHIMLFYTRWGLRTRAVGEHPRAADTLGVNVFRTRYVNVILGGLVAGIGGAFFTIGSVGGFDEGMTAGKGFIGLAAMIFGKWTPFGTFGSSLIFGFADALQTKLQILNIAIPSEFLLMLPYLATMVVLAGVIGRAVSPAADGKPYEKESG